MLVRRGPCPWATRVPARTVWRELKHGANRPTVGGRPKVIRVRPHGAQPSYLYSPHLTCTSPSPVHRRPSGELRPRHGARVDGGVGWVASGMTVAVVASFHERGRGGQARRGPIGSPWARIRGAAWCSGCYLPPPRALPLEARRGEIWGVSTDQGNIK